MKILHLPLLVSLAVLCLQSQQVQSQTMMQQMVEAMTTTVPCMAPCVFRNLVDITNDFNRTCFGQLLKNIENVAKSFPTPSPPSRWTPPPHGGPIAQPGASLSPVLNVFNNSEEICTLIKETADCTETIAHKYCGSDLTNALRRQFDKSLEYMPCPGNQGPKAKVIKCAYGYTSVQTATNCVETIQKTHSDILSKFQKPYSEIYDELLVPKPGTTDPPKICDIGKTFKTCYISNLKKAQSADCPEETVNIIEVELNGALDLINCRTHEPKNDALTCMGKPALVERQVIPCFSNFDYTQFNQVLHPTQVPRINLDKACAALPLIDTCITEKLEKEPACQDDGWTLTTYRALITPSRDYLINEHCQSSGKTPSNPAGAGTCKNTFADYTYGAIDPNGASTFSLSLQLSGSILSMWTMWVLHK